MSNFLSRGTLFVVCPAVFICGTLLLASYSSRPGEVGEFLTDLPSRFAVESASEGDEAASHLFLFYHPHCPCTAATARNLARLSPRFSNAPKIIAYAFCPEGEPESWVDSRTTRGLKRIPGCAVVIDYGATASYEFGVRTSGQVLLYGSKGRLRFSGGITPARGHEGDSLGGRQLVRLVNAATSHSIATLAESPVYGCAIVNRMEKKAR